MATSPTQLTLKHLRDDGWTAEIVEHWNPHARIRHDLLGFIEAVHGAVQGAGDLARRRRRPVLGRVDRYADTSKKVWGEV